MPEPDGEASPQIRLTRTQPEPDANLARGHASLQRGETELSRREFEQALQRDPNNTDALLALAAIAHRQGRAADADGLRQRALVANPSDPATQAAVLNNLSVNADPTTAESRLKSLLSSQPESAPLNFALGNLYSRQARWAEAQQVYFNAVAADGDNPDYLFNLAVSLDHLRQARLAAQHYRLALEASAKRPAGFARDKVEQRLGELQPGPQR
ncbi:MAG: tetratricopeptide repeat protein [Rhodoferax sp.]